MDTKLIADFMQTYIATSPEGNERICMNNTEFPTTNTVEFVLSFPFSIGKRHLVDFRIFS